MDPGQWETINRIFHSALEAQPSQREALMLAECEDHPEILDEVQRLLQADVDVGSYLDKPLIAAEPAPFPSYSVATGEVLCARFRILRPIASGGMGFVFEAIDQELGVHVALKVIRPEIASTAQTLARFRQEVRLARNITHPNICRTFDLERDTRIVDNMSVDIVFLTMEYLAGETLARRIARLGPLPLDNALELARQIASALQAAHLLGVVHRDIKPANVMLVEYKPAQPTPRAVITDFGLARLDPVSQVAGSENLTGTGAHIGTLAYMAPEQLEGNPATSATDLYAFGLILFEMTTGQQMFATENPLSGIASRLKGVLPEERIADAKLTQPWRAAIQWCMALDPAARPRDALVVIDHLSAAPSFLQWHPARLNKRRRSRILAASLIISLSLALFLVGLRLYRARADARVTAGALVYLVPSIHNASAKSLDSIPELMRASLSQSAQITLLGPARAGDILQHMTRSPQAPIDAATAREIALRAGAVRVIFTDISRNRDRYSLNVEIQQPDIVPTRYRAHWTRSFMCPADEHADSSASFPPRSLKLYDPPAIGFAM